MSIGRCFALFAVFLAIVGSGWCQPVLSIDFNMRNGSAGLTEPGFDAFLIGGASGAQTAPTSVTFGAITVTVSGNGPDARYDDRERTLPTDSGDFTQSALLRDFVRSPSVTNNAGLNVQLQGLTANQVYKVTIWSFDAGSNNRFSDWDANGFRVRENYTFNTANPTNNMQYQFSFKVHASTTGEILIEGRRDSFSGANAAVFLNALQVEPSTADEATVEITPNLDVFAGDNVVLTGQVSGTPPVSLQWLKEGNPVTGATNNPLVIFDAPAGKAGAYSLAASNAAGMVTSAVSIVTVMPMTSLMSGLISHWPMDEATTVTPDVMPVANDLWLTNMDAANLVLGHAGNALAFNGVDELATRIHTSAATLPIYPYAAYTVALWVKGDFTNQNDRRVFAESADTTPATFSIGTHYQGSSGTIDILVRNNNGTTPLNHRNSTLVAFDNTWHHIAWVDNNGYPKLYVDGVADTNSFDYIRGALTPNITSVGGLVRATNGNWFAGAIDQVAAWRRSLSASEIQQVIASGVPEPVRILTTAVANGTVTLVIRTPEPGRAHHIEQVSALGTTSWSEVPNVTFAANGNTLTAQIAMPSETQRFYRVNY